MPSKIWGQDKLTCPLPTSKISQMQAHARSHPSRGDTTLTCPAHFADTTAILEPGRATWILYSLDYGYHRSGWFANSQFERCLHLSLSHPRPDRLRMFPSRDGLPGRLGITAETPSDAEARLWGYVFFGRYAPLSLFEPAASVFDAYRSPNVVHLRLWLDQAGAPINPQGEVYDLRPFADGTSPKKVTEGRLGADVK